MDLIIKTDTFLKKNSTSYKGTEQAFSLPDNLKYKVNKNTVLSKVLAYTEIDNHYLITFDKAYSGFNSWYIFKDHCYLSTNPLLTKVINYFIKKNYSLNERSDEINICGLEFTDLKERDKFNDLILLFNFNQKVGKLIATYRATTEAGTYYTNNPMNPKGCAKLAYGQYKAWQVGLHNGKYEALVQAKPVKVFRDKNKDFDREGDQFEEGIYGINIHHAYSSSNIDKYSAGCQVVQSHKEFAKFLELVKKDVNYIKDKDHLFTYTLVEYNSL